LQLPDESIVSGNVTVLITHYNFVDVPEGEAIPDLDVVCTRITKGRYAIEYPQMN
jgi:hypothetical protein